jgi:hypothetical protein
MTQLIVKDKDDEIREYHLKRLEQLSLKSIKEKPQLEKLNNEQINWVKRKMKGVWH